MVKDDNSSHHMITRSKNKISNKGIKKNANKKKKKKYLDDDNYDDNYDDNNKINELAFLYFLLSKLENEENNVTDNLLNKFNENIIDEEYNSEEENIIDEDISLEMKYLENQLLNEKINNDIPFKYKILKSNISNDIKRVIVTNINYFNTLAEQSSEYQKMKSWMNCLEQIPFGNYVDLPVSYKSKPTQIYNFLKKLQCNLNNCIYGQNKAKESILQIVTQIITNPNGNGNIIALKGPPGVGKTSLIKHGLAKSLNLPFSFITLGGINDSSYFDGFSYTYEGSKCGKLCNVLIETGCMNPIIFMDELDKISNTDKGDEINNLLVHITDFTQNDHFEDKYFSGIPLDLSKAIFIFSLNNEHYINPILKDRLNIIRLDEFKLNEKIIIAKDYLIPELINNIGIKEKIIFERDIIEYIINNFSSNESGVRELKRCLEAILRKINVLKYSRDIKLDFKINNLTFPLKITKEIIDILIKEKKHVDNTYQLMMYS